MYVSLFEYVYICLHVGVRLLRHSLSLKLNRFRWKTQYILEAPRQTVNMRSIYLILIITQSSQMKIYGVSVKAMWPK